MKACAGDRALRSPFLLFGGGQGNIEGAGIDSILPYWMARYYGVALAG